MNDCCLVALLLCPQIVCWGDVGEENVNPVLLVLPIVTLIHHEGDDLMTSASLDGPCLLTLPHWGAISSM